MKFASKVMILALIALPLGSVYAAPPSGQLTVTITVTATETLDIVFTAGGTTATWAPTGVALATTFNSKAQNSVGLDIKNNGNAAVNISAIVDVANKGTPWNPATAPAVPNSLTLNEYGIAACPDITAAPPSIVVFDAATAQVFVPAILGKASTSNLVLQITTPTSVSTVKPANIVVFFSASLN